MKKRNGDIAVVKFIFMVLIIIMHYNIPFAGKKYALEGAYIYVDFFFIIIGYYMVNTIGNQKETIKSTCDYVWSKFKRFFPWVLVQSVFLMPIELLFFCEGYKDVIKLLSGIVMDCSFTSLIYPINYHYNGSLWFLSAAILVGGVVHFFFKQYEKTFLFLAPIVGIGIYNYMIIKNGDLDIWHSFVCSSFFQDALFRALAGMLLGVFCRFMVEQYKENGAFLSDKLIVVIEVVSIICSICFAFLVPHTSYDFIQIVLFLIIIWTCNIRENPFSGSFFRYLDKITLPMYVFQVVCIRVVLVLFDNITWLNMLVILSLDFIISNMLIKVENMWIKSRNR